MTKYLLATFLLFGFLSFADLRYVAIAQEVQIVSQSMAQINGGGTSDAGTICVSNSTLDILGQQACGTAEQDAKTKCGKTCVEQCGLETPSAECYETIFHEESRTAGQCSQTNASKFIGWISGGRLGVPRFTKPCTISGKCQYFCKASPASQALQPTTREPKTTRGQKDVTQKPQIIYSANMAVPPEGSISQVSVIFKGQIREWLARTYYVYLTITQGPRSVTTWNFSSSGDDTNANTGVFYLPNGNNANIAWSPSQSVDVTIYAVSTRDPSVTAYGDCVVDGKTYANVSNHKCNQFKNSGNPTVFYTSACLKAVSSGFGPILFRSSPNFMPVAHAAIQIPEDLKNRINQWFREQYFPSGGNYTPNTFDCDDYARNFFDWMKGAIERGELGWRNPSFEVYRTANGVFHVINDAEVVSPTGPVWQKICIEPQGPRIVDCPPPDQSLTFYSNEPFSDGQIDGNDVDADGDTALSLWGRPIQVDE